MLTYCNVGRIKTWLSQPMFVFKIQNFTKLTQNQTRTATSFTTDWRPNKLLLYVCACSTYLLCVEYASKVIKTWPTHGWCPSLVTTRHDSLAVSNGNDIECCDCWLITPPQCSLYLQHTLREPSRGADLRFRKEAATAFRFKSIFLLANLWQNNSRCCRNTG